LVSTPSAFRYRAFIGASPTNVATDWLLAEVADQRLLDFAMLIVQGFQLLLGCRLRSPNPAQHHLDQLVSAAHAGLSQQTEQQRVSLSWPVFQNPRQIAVDGPTATSAFRSCAERVL
jgi:hypothetical protein